MGLIDPLAILPAHPELYPGDVRIIIPGDLWSPLTWIAEDVAGEWGWVATDAEVGAKSLQPRMHRDAVVNARWRWVEVGWHPPKE